MRSALRRFVAGVSVCLTSIAAHAQAGSPSGSIAINFDQIDATAGDVILGQLQGFTFVNFSAYTGVPGFPGFNNGIVSASNAAYASDIGEIYSTTPFDFLSAYLGSGYYDNLFVTVEGTFGGVLRGTQTVMLGTAAAQLFNFNFTGIDALAFRASTSASTTDPYFCGAVGCSYFTIDDAIVIPLLAPPAVVPEPSTFLLLALGGIILVCLMKFTDLPIRFIQR